MQKENRTWEDIYGDRCRCISFLVLPVSNMVIGNMRIMMYVVLGVTHEGSELESVGELTGDGRASCLIYRRWRWHWLLQLRVQCVDSWHKLDEVLEQPSSDVWFMSNQRDILAQRMAKLRYTIHEKVVLAMLKPEGSLQRLVNAA